MWSRDGIKTGLWSMGLNDPDITECFRRTLQLLAEHQERGEDEEDLVAQRADGDQLEQDQPQLGTPWFRYFLRYDPVPNLARIQVPVLALSGALDVQVPASENLPAIRAALAANPDVTVVEFEGLNHLFQTSQTGAVGEYADIEETFAPVALEAMSAWIAERFLEN